MKICTIQPISSMEICDYVIFDLISILKNDHRNVDIYKLFVLLVCGYYANSPSSVIDSSPSLFLDSSLSTCCIVFLLLLLTSMAFPY